MSKGGCHSRRARPGGGYRTRLSHPVGPVPGPGQRFLCCHLEWWMLQVKWSSLDGNWWSGPPGGRAFLDYEPSMSSDQALGWFEQTNPELQELTHTSLLAPDSRRATHLPTPPHHATNSGQWTSHSQHTQPRTPTHSPTPTQSCQQTTNTHANQTTGNRKRKTGQTKHKQNDTTQHRVLKTGQHYPPRVKKEMRIDRALEGLGRTW